MFINFYTVVKYFWVLMFVLTMVAFMMTWDLDNLWRAGFTVLMIIIFAIVDAYQRDHKVLTK
ncbi:hypothetical protein QCN32_gp78 [Arthrobacter phage Niktson]|uniref:Uncharacterized protein n=2 Tax=Gordonvirus TaxID=1982152 RepID=A0A218M5P4_9CAUD|nr:hypothetical protein QCN31_gp79 [Arthrobacter phage Teacup]YP_010749908.1 hypothetical protein QCN32_gp78 [Arthrobacter phage Niktson]ASD52297.1 hypothetical protein NIKTSON_78 [Arthrobacter phage Niktson]ASD52391.1 hypothetical protein ELEPHANTMAN_78 [Arthrobacter phage ElephantMan]ASR84075.1 hypothetical protein SEA_TEACUP_79 [Arthrobacter phage Teacup]